MSPNACNVCKEYPNGRKSNVGKADGTSGTIKVKKHTSLKQVFPTEGSAAKRKLGSKAKRVNK